MAWVSCDGGQLALGELYIVNLAVLIELERNVVGLYQFNGNGVEQGAVGVPVERVLGEDLLVVLDVRGHGVAAIVPHGLVGHRLNFIDAAQLVNHALCHWVKSNVGSQRIEVWFLGYAGVDNSVVVRSLDADHLTELGAFACIQRFGFLFAQGLGVLIVLLCARDHFHRHCGVVGIVLVEVEYPLQAGCKVVCYDVCLLVAVHVYPLRIVAELEGPGQTAILRTPLFRDTRNQLALRVGLQQAVHQAGQVLAVLSTLCVQDVEGLQLSGCQSWDVQVLDGVFGGVAGACTGLALRAGFSVAACVAAAAASCQDHCCCQRQREQSGKCLFHNWLFLLRLSEALL